MRNRVFRPRVHSSRSEYPRRVDISWLSLFVFAFAVTMLFRVAGESPKQERNDMVIMN